MPGRVRLHARMSGARDGRGAQPACMGAEKVRTLEYAPWHQRLLVVEGALHDPRLHKAARQGGQRCCVIVASVGVGLGHGAFRRGMAEDAVTHRLPRPLQAPLHPPLSFIRANTPEAKYVTVCGPIFALRIAFM
jgi:hypothetical protein